jgi:hypothetical protein
MVGRDVRDDGDVRAATQQVELEAAQLEHDDRRSLNQWKQVEHWFADISANRALDSGSVQYVADEPGRRRLSAAPRHAEDPAREEVEEQRRHALDVQSGGSGRLIRRVVFRHPWTDKEIVSFVNQLWMLSAQN